MATASLLLLAVSSESRLTLKPGCQTSCDGVDIPYPFGIGQGCFRPGFEIACVNSMPILANTSDAIQVLSLSVTPRPEARVMLPVAYQCYNSTGDPVKWNSGSVDFNRDGMYRVSNTGNQLFILGCNTFAYTNSGPSGRSIYTYYTGCAAYCDNAQSARDGECSGVGCCHVDIPPDLSDNRMRFTDDPSWSHPGTEFSLCDYAFIVEKGNYTFQKADLKMDLETSKPLRLDWAIRVHNGSSLSCTEAPSMPGYACVSEHSECLDSTNGPGYVCNCTKGYEGNPYLHKGCTNLNECARPREEFPCNGLCHDTEGSYDCKCHLGYESSGDPKENPCNPKFPLPARIALGIGLGVSILVFALLLAFILHQKRKLAEHFEMNGGNILKQS